MSTGHVLEYLGLFGDRGEVEREWDVIHPPSCPQRPMLDDADQVVCFEYTCGTGRLIQGEGWDALTPSTSTTAHPDDLQPGLYLLRRWTSGSGESWTTGVEIVCSVDDALNRTGAA